MTDAQNLITEIENAATSLGIAPSTVGERAGQGGRFYARLKEGRRVWPETANKVRTWISKETSKGRDGLIAAPFPRTPEGR